MMAEAGVPPLQGEREAMLHFDAVLFDSGDTLFHKRVIPEALIRFSAELGVVIGEEEAAAAWRAAKSRTDIDPEVAFGRNRSREGHRSYYLERYRPLDELVPGLGKAFYNGFKTDAESMVPYPDTADTLARLRDHGVKIGVVSNTGWDIRKGYELIGIDHLVDTFVLSFQHGIAKPDAGLFAEACRRLGVQPERSIMVGNDAKADGGAAAIGCTCLILPPVERGKTRGLEAVMRLIGIEHAGTSAAA